MGGMSRVIRCQDTFYREIYVVLYLTRTYTATDTMEQVWGSILAVAKCCFWISAIICSKLESFSMIGTLSFCTYDTGKSII